MIIAFFKTIATTLKKYLTKKFKLIRRFDDNS